MCFWELLWKSPASARGSLLLLLLHYCCTLLLVVLDHDDMCMCQDMQHSSPAQDPFILPPFIDVYEIILTEGTANSQPMAPLLVN